MKLKSQRFRGQGLVEYALILALVAIVVIVILAVLGPEIGNVFSDIVAVLEQVSERAAAPTPELDPEAPPPECYGTLLLPIMLAATAAVTALTRFLPADQLERLFLTSEG
ncbi:MAG: hypothetical protein JXB38_05400 [Anaerolineales bacterium]|nr:hypothetical protein [Anaerolineales bacterium]